MNVKSAFLHDNFEKDIYIKLLEEFTASKNEDLDYKLQKFLYKLKQAS